MTQPVPERRADALLSAALDAAERGWHVFPLRPGGKRPALHGQARCPRTGECAAGHRKWEQRATTDPDRIHAAWSAGPFNVGIATGPSGLVVIDLDTPKDRADAPGGAATFQALCERTGQPVPTTYRTRTASGGEHLYFAAPPGIRLHNTAGTLAPLIDTRAWGGYVVAPGSVTDTGTYEVVDAAPVAPLPGWLLDALRPAPRSAGPVSVAVTALSGRYAEAALQNETATVATAQEGGREAALFRAARALGRFVAWGDLPRHVVENALQQAGESAGLPPAQCRSTLRSALNWSITHNQQRRTA
ncbi:bifunctional DNA primase/polymerase [Streptomyces mangrovi]|uniref:bifunctional DNA primase/polymerase n=1 Tax=Streptomyces mangrovi TaxID=1206892 RepID=UPI00399D4BDE